MRSFPLVTVIIPCFNNDKYVAEAIESALNQTYPSIEVIVVNDGSTDSSLHEINQYKERIQIITTPNQGACAARNIGLFASNGEYIQFLDADDILLPDKIATQIPYLIDRQADLVFCNGFLFGDDRPQRPIKKLAATPDPDGWDPMLYFMKYGVGTESPLHRCDCLLNVGGFCVGLPAGQEVDLHLRLGVTNIKIKKISEFLYKHRNADDPTRITRKPKPPGLNLLIALNVLEQFKLEISKSPQIDSIERHKALATFLYQQSIYAFRNGSEDLAKHGFKEAVAIYPKPDFQERQLYIILSRFVDPIWLETGLKQLRRLKQIVFKSFKLLP